MTTRQHPGARPNLAPARRRLTGRPAKTWPSSRASIVDSQSLRPGCDELKAIKAKPARGPAHRHHRPINQALKGINAMFKARATCWPRPEDPEGQDAGLADRTRAHRRRAAPQTGPPPPSAPAPGREAAARASARPNCPAAAKPRPKATQAAQLATAAAQSAAAEACRSQRTAQMVVARSWPSRQAEGRGHQHQHQDRLRRDELRLLVAYIATRRVSPKATRPGSSPSCSAW